jgi:1-deoxy-D-xylulose-5-phosphate synthase
MDLNTFSVGKLHGMSPAQLKDLAAEIREFLIDKVSKTGGHLGSFQ